MTCTRVILNRIADIKTVEEYDAVVRKGRLETLQRHSDTNSPKVTLKDCLPNENRPVNLENVPEGMVAFATMVDGIRMSPSAALMIPNKDGSLQHKRVLIIYLLHTGCYVKVNKYKNCTDVLDDDAWVNGHTIVLGTTNHTMAGSIISPGGKIGIAYQVVLVHMRIDIWQTRHAARTAFADETKCPVCLEVIVKAVSSDVCNHRFCHSCIKNIQKITNKQNIKCPCCNSNATKWLHDPSMDNMIWLGALAGNLVADDARTFLQRKLDSSGMSGGTKEQIASICWGGSSM